MMKSASALPYLSERQKFLNLLIACLVGIRFYEWKADWIMFVYFRFWCLIVMRIYVLMILQIHFMSCDLLIFTSTCKVFLKTEHWISGINTTKRRVDAVLKARGDIPLPMMTTMHQLDSMEFGKVLLEGSNTIRCSSDS